MKKLHIILVLLLLALVSPTFGQKTKSKSKKQLQSEINSLQKEISTANQLLKKTKKDKEMTLNEVNLVDKKIKQRENLILQPANRRLRRGNQYGTKQHQNAQLRLEEAP